MPLPQVGTLLQPFGDAIPGTLASPWSQPGGPGTTVFPQPYDSAAGQFEPPLISIGQYLWGCGHITNLPWIFKAYDDDSEEEAALICCPVCSYIQMILEPYERYLNYIDTPIVIAGA
jgi:hypothetical protein